MTGDFRVITIAEHTPIKGKDRIVSSFAHGEIIVISKEENPIGIRGLLFDCESTINVELLSELNLFREITLNKDPEKVGYFRDARVRPQIFAGVKCSGFFLSFKQLQNVEWLSGIDKLKDGYCGNSFNKIELCQKWIPPRRNQSQKSTGLKRKDRLKSKIVQGQFQFHKSTGHLGDAYGAIKPEMLVSLTHKLHGTSAIFTNVLCRKKVGFFKKLLTLGLYRPIEYTNIYSSRQVVKNDLNSHQKNHYYKADVWGAANELVKDSIEPGISLYAEITGYIPGTESCIQKGYDYRSNVGEFQYWIYRITYTTPEGVSIDFSTNEIITYCRKYKLQMVPIIYAGPIGDFFQAPEEHYGRNLFDFLSKKFLEKDCMFCRNKVPGEGIVLRFEYISSIWSAFKLKSFAFRKIEAGATEADIETEN